MSNKTICRERYYHSLERLREILTDEPSRYLIQNEARILLEASYGGPWRMIWALIKKQAERAWRHRAL